MFSVTTAELTAWLGQYLWPLFRISALLMFMPLIGAASVPMRIRLVLSLALAYLVAPIIPAIPVVEALSPEGLSITLHELAIGITGALLLHIFMAIFTSAGQMLSMQMGLGMAVMMDPVNGVSIPILGQFYQLMSFLMFLGLNGHLVVIELLIGSFEFLPISGSLNFLDTLNELTRLVAWMFSSALLIALPAITAMLIVNFTFGVMNRTAPQLNLFSLGFPMAMVCGLISLLFSVSSTSTLFVDLTEQCMSLLRTIWTIGG